MLRYLATRSGDTQIYPSDLPDRATVNWLLDAIATFLRPALFPIEEAAFGLRAGRGLGAEPPDADGGSAAFAAALPKLVQFQGLLDDASPWACCGRFTIADVAATPVLHRLRRTGLPLTDDPAPRGLGRGLLRAAGLGGRRGDRGRLASSDEREDALGRAPHRGEHELLRHAGPLEAEEEARRAEPRRRARAPGGRTSRARRR